MNEKWLHRWIKRAQDVADWSKDPSTVVGCILMDPASNTSVSEGFNGFPRAVNDDIESRWVRPDKYLWVAHAERNSVYNAARLGRATLGTWAFMNFEPTPCTGCAQALIQAGVVRIVGPDRPFEGKGAMWEKELRIAAEMLGDAGVLRQKVTMS